MLSTIEMQKLHHMDSTASCCQVISQTGEIFLKLEYEQGNPNCQLHQCLTFMEVSETYREMLIIQIVIAKMPLTLKYLKCL